MTTKKPFPWQAVGVIIGAVIFASGVIANNARLEERVSTIDKKTVLMCAEQKEVENLNSAEHKIIMASLTRIETKMEYISGAPQRYAFTPRRRDTTR